MVALEQGVLNGSHLYFHTASTQAQKAFFYPLCTGHFFCDQTYEIKRNNYDSYLLIFVKKGSGYVTIDSVTYEINENQIALIDCYGPHSYSTQTGWEIFWLHFDGVTAKAFYQLIYELWGNIITTKDIYTIEKSLSRIYEMFHKKLFIKEVLISKYITNLLTELLISTDKPQDSNHTNAIEEIISYIGEHLLEDLTIDSLAKRVSLSPYYFLRIFQKETGFTPHQYVIQTRINSAKFFLKTSNSPIKEIGFQCGFKTESSFCTTFLKCVGVTPTKYRNSLSHE